MSAISAKISMSDVDDFVEHSRKLVPGFQVNYDKESSYLMHIIHGLIFPFNRGFMKEYVTTIFGRVYYPSVEAHPSGILRVLMHELVHAYDAKRLTPLVFVLLYLTPQILTVPALILCGIFASWLALLPLGAIAVHLLAVAVKRDMKWATGFPLLVGSLVAMVWFEGKTNGASNLLWFLLSILPLAPWPSPGRMWAELRGYGMSVHAEYWLWGHSFIGAKIKQFTGPNYYFMWPFTRYIYRKLVRYQSDARQGILRGKVYSHCWDWINGIEGVHKPQGATK